MPSSDAYIVAKWALLKEWLRIEIFDKNDADSPYQNGYLDALRAVRKEMEK